LNSSFKSWLPVVSILATITAALFGYRNTLAEPDMARMVTGVVYGAATGSHIFAGNHYGIEFSFAYYELLYNLIPESALRDPDYVARFINNLGIVFTFLFAVALGLMLNKLVNPGVAAFSAIGFLFCPLVLPFLSSGHPMIGACAFLFFGCWLILVSVDKKNAYTVAIYLAFAFIALTLSLTLRGEVALAFPFVVVAYMVSAKRQDKLSFLRGITVCLVIALAFGCFLYLQRPFVVSEGGATNSLAGFLLSFASIKSVARGIGIVLNEFGVLSLLFLTLAMLRFKDKASIPLILACLALIIPSLLFWLPTPSPARHFVIPILGLYVLLGQLGSNRLNAVQPSIIMAILLVFGNQALAELTRPIIAKGSFTASGARRPSQQVPLGFFPLDQQANMTKEEELRAEAIQLSAAKPQKLLILSNHLFYAIPRLLADDPSLRLTPSKVGKFESFLLASPNRKIYLIEKFHYLPRDVLSEILNSNVMSDYPIYVQKETITPDDKTEIPAIRQYKIE
jgi:hypothetical protein